MAVRLQGEWRLLRLKLLKAKSEITEYLSSEQKPSRASCLHTEWPRGGVGMGAEGRKRRRLTEERKPVAVNDVLYALTACPQQSEWQRKKQYNKKVHLWKVSLRWETWQQTHKYTQVIIENKLSGVHWTFWKFDSLSNYKSHVGRPWWNISGSVCQLHFYQPLLHLVRLYSTSMRNMIVFFRFGLTISSIEWCSNTFYLLCYTYLSRGGFVCFWINCTCKDSYLAEYFYLQINSAQLRCRQQLLGCKR